MNENFKRFGDIYKASVYGSKVYVISSPEYCERILRWNWQNYPRQGLVVKRIGMAFGNSLIASNGEFWASQRRMIQPAFCRNAVAGLAETIATVNFELLHKWKEASKRRKMVNVTRDVGELVLKITLLSIFGDDYETSAPNFRFVAAEFGRSIEFANSLRSLGSVVLQIIEQRRRAGKRATDTLGMLLEARDRGHGKPMPDAQIVREVLTLVVAGHETTASLLNWMWYLLARHPQTQSKLLREFDRLPWKGTPSLDTFPRYAYTRQVIDEALRLYPPLWLMSRKAVHDDRLGEFFVPAGTEIYISPYLIQRSPHLWSEPDKFDPERFAPENKPERHGLALCPFGAGPRNCIGEFLARIESQMHLMIFAKELSLRYEETAQPEFTTRLNLLSKHDFMMLPELN